MNITDFLLARIAEDENEAKDANYDPADHWWLPPAARRARLKAEVEVKRKIVRLHESAGWGYESECNTCGSYGEYGVDWPCDTIRALAAVYADHPDYNPEWSTS